MIQIYAIVGLTVALSAAGGWIWHLRGEQGAARAQMAQLEAVNAAALAAAGRLTAEKMRADGEVARWQQDSQRRAAQAAREHRRLTDALVSDEARDWAAVPVPAGVVAALGLRPDSGGGSAGGAADPAAPGVAGPAP